MDEGDTPPSPDDPEWDAWVERQLEDVEFDTELGKSMAEDAIRVAEGELSKAEFHRRHTEAVEEEFGVDERPTKCATRPEGTAPKVPDGDGRSRRNVLKAVGGAAAATGTAGLAGYVRSGGDSPGEQPSGGPPSDGRLDDHEDDAVDGEPESQLGMVIDTERCIACLQCSQACKEENGTDVGTHWTYVFRYEDEMRGETREGSMPRGCQHCSEPTCSYVCPTQARFKREEDGLVLTDYDTCIGCRYCQVACPYGVNFLGQDEPSELGGEFEYDREGRNGHAVAGSPPDGVMGKCTFCVHRQDSEDEELQGTTACEQACPVDALHFGDMTDPESDPRQHLREKSDSNQYKLLDGVGNEPNNVYVGPKPSKDAVPIQGPTTYEERGMDDGNYEYPVPDGRSDADDDPAASEEEGMDERAGSYGGNESDDESGGDLP